jgi:hypothetical protein
MGLFFMLIDPRRSQKQGGSILIGLDVAAAIAVSGTIIYLIRAQNLRQWPFARPV